MTHTLAAVFDNGGDADRAKTALITAGFDRNAVRITADPGTSAGAGTGGTATQKASDDGGGITSSIMDFFSDMFGGNDDKQVYSEAVNRGKVVLTLEADTDDQIDRATDIIEGFGPLDIDDQQSEWRAGGWSGGMPMHSGSGMGSSSGMQQSASAGSQQNSQQSTLQGSQGSQGDMLQGGSYQGASQGSGSMQRAGTETQTQAIPVIQEELKVGKRTVQRGGVRVFQRVVETPVQESVTLREEHVTVDRRPVDQAIDPDQVQAFQDQSFELRESAEEAVVEKSARIVEEVVVGKEVSQRQDQISDTVRSTEVEVEQIDAGDNDAYYRSHWQTNYGSTGGRYEDYDPAYRYGSSMASNATYKGRPWDEVEPELRRNWEGRYPQSAWENFKAAIREGWNRMMST
jgi:uncharacterized protein (TIGR02271 family)